ncbi:FMN-binding protein [Streptomyces stelliscabiei]|uniref:FMN-binding protein n=1 Tax=Streptomyces stelliscabiei TaxID=146820 RepID=UPI0029ADCB93|nr:FMN-binding protein [Streptomyces stelliscabiei]MDX2553393.1 FMN-binding protein [Streptomyces stelliscabiei]MDX2612429.1 FMN-binding protein [Streptomyces stelliscabiei]MDX2637697.1 FMN-binding protein [Streptomyces stelliscabiei]MDX2663627.1 FMN-binding protein [Streptomyces stelliscabiei]MDX2717111.1 FMN-binding protein [Streptomyces stelliscabiei]
MKRVIPALVLSAAALVPVWRYSPSTATTTTVTAEPAPSASAAAGSTVVKGPTVDTEKGPVQVQATFRGEKITGVSMLQQPNHPQTEAAVPVLIEETLEAQSADIDTVSGATITSDAYRESLQATIDENGKSASSADSDSGSGSDSAAGSAPEDSEASGESTSRTVAGPTVGTSKGDVQVQVTFEGDAIASVEMLKQPNHPQTEAAVPVLIKETLEAQNADIDTVSGATITSDGYRESLQAALDAKA